MYLKIILFIILQLVLNYVYKSWYDVNFEPKNIIAIAHLNGEIKGSVLFYEDKKRDRVKIKINLSGLPKNKELGFHHHVNHCRPDLDHFSV